MTSPSSFAHRKHLPYFSDRISSETRSEFKQIETANFSRSPNGNAINVKNFFYLKYIVDFVLFVRLIYQRINGDHAAAVTVADEASVPSISIRSYICFLPLIKY